MIGVVVGGSQQERAMLDAAVQAAGGSLCQWFDEAVNQSEKMVFIFGVTEERFLIEAIKSCLNMHRLVRICVQADSDALRDSAMGLGAVGTFSSSDLTEEGKEDFIARLRELGAARCPTSDDFCKVPPLRYLFLHPLPY